MFARLFCPLRADVPLLKVVLSKEGSPLAFAALPMWIHAALSFTDCGHVWRQFVSTDTDDHCFSSEAARENIRRVLSPPPAGRLSRWTEAALRATVKELVLWRRMEPSLHRDSVRDLIAEMEQAIVTLAPSMTAATAQA